ncbi:glycosyltransferase [Gracilibacillus caseinilyticus]|uniref:Glycosyltransferase n=1 Tax=Gracilibacillus caseinilyticus TaxID=2932256 RepID=A0ABY4F355_9BACI|nr:glycosyltransferase [Gracilibacillus caseinilyticus]UOQ50671.1 glycosyltransferase [Gracilibacillus caseinilyticus]
MNILFVYYVPSGGVETLNRQRSAVLQSHHINPHFLYYEKRRELVNDHGAPTYITKDVNDLKEILAKNNYSALVVTSDFDILPVFRSLGFRGKIILEIQGYGPKSVAKSVLQSAVPTVMKHADAFLTPKTPHIVELIDEFYPTVPTFHFNNSFDTKQFGYVPSSEKNSPIIAWIGRIEDNKNWREFLQIGKEMIQYNSNIQLYMYEDPTISTPTERNAFNLMIKELGLEDSLTIHANVPHEKMAEHFSRIGDSGGFLCSTSKVEGAPLSILEAMSCRCPVLTTDSDGVKSSVIHNQTGKYYTLGNVTEAVEQAKELMSNHSSRNAIIKNADSHLQTSFSPECYGQNFVKMLHDLGVK